MYKIKKIKFYRHAILGNFSLDFCDLEGNTVDTVIFAGENGTGKSTILNEIYGLVSRNSKCEADVLYEKDEQEFIISYRMKENSISRQRELYANDGVGSDKLVATTSFGERYPTTGIFSDVDINFHAEKVSAVTSLVLDAKGGSRRSSNNFPKQINQLLIDIQALDDADMALAMRRNPEKCGKDLHIQERIPRFTKAFNYMFDGLTYSHIENRDGYKTILFNKNGINVPIEALSSGEKQIVYRGCFLLKDVHAINGAFVFIDEPEISLHPVWQMKVMEYYKGIFTDKSGLQTSQIFAVTHSPFVVHNENRKNDKVIVLDRDQNGEIIVKDKPEYFKCTSIDVIQDAFSIRGFSDDKPTVYLEGRTDEKYFNKAADVFGYTLPFQFKWIGYMKDDKNEENTGKDALNKAVQFLIGRNLAVKNVCLFDCDTKRMEFEKNNVYVRVIPLYENVKQMKKGIENALILDSIDTSPYYSSKIKEGDYGDRSTIVEFKKMEFCEYICSLDSEIQKNIFLNLKTEIDSLIKLFDKE